MTAYVFRPMNDEEAREISGWSYDPPYDFYDATSDPGDLAELLEPKWRRQGAYYAAFDESGALVGFFQFEKIGRISPEGSMLAGLEFARRHFSPTGFRLSVATFNERAGFRRGEVFMHHTNGGDHPFLSMTREA
jgi:ribosomal-protein-alanine N-acetyltransferase